MNVKEQASALAARWRADKLWGSLAVCWIATVFSSFLGPVLFPVTLPAVGTVYLFRVLLPVSAVLYALYAAREKERIWRDASAAERWCYVLIAVMLIYGAASLPRALDLGFTFRRLFNLCFDLCFFFLLLRLGRNKRLRGAVLVTCALSAALLFLLGLLQTLTAPPYDSETNRFHYFFFLKGVHMAPDVGFGNPNDYAAAMVFTAAVLLPPAAALWKRAGRAAYWAAAAGIVLLYYVVAADRARLVAAGFWILLAAFILFLLLSDRKRLWIPLVSLALMGCVWLGTQYRYIMPSVREYIAQMEEYRRQEQSGEAQPGQAAPPKLQIRTEPSQTFEEQFFTENEETGEKELRQEGSGGIRARMLLHAFRCFRESYGLGVGLGNTETLAPRRNIVPGWADGTQNNVHCFIARILADFGIFALIPLCAIALLLLKAVWVTLRAGVKSRSSFYISLSLVYFFVLLSYPFLSTASSDSQDLFPMWIYLAAAVLYASASSGGEERLERAV